MKISTVLSGAALALLISLSAQGQSLGEQAREARANKPAAPQSKVYNNDNLPTGSTISTIGSAPAAETSGTSDGTTSDAAAPAEGQQAAAASSDADAKQKEQEKIKADVDAKKDEISRLERELDIATREWRLRQAAYYADAGNQLRNPAGWAEQERHYNDDINQKKQAIDAAKQQLDDMQEQGRKAGMTSSQTE